MGIECITGQPYHGDREERDEQEDELHRLRRENENLRAEIADLQLWPEEMNHDPNEPGHATAWQQRALIAERKLALAYERLRQQDLDIAEMRLDAEGGHIVNPTPLPKPSPKAPADKGVWIFPTVILLGFVTTLSLGTILPKPHNYYAARMSVAVFSLVAGVSAIFAGNRR